MKRLQSGFVFELIASCGLVLMVMIVWLGELVIAGDCEQVKLCACTGFGMAWLKRRETGFVVMAESK